MMSGSQWSGTQASFGDVVDRTSEPLWLKDFRKKAWERFNTLEWSHLDRDEWRVLKSDRFLNLLSAPSGSGLGKSLLRVPSGVSSAQLSDLSRLKSNEVSLLRETLEDALQAHTNDKWWLFVMAHCEALSFVHIPDGWSGDVVRLTLEPPRSGAFIALQLVSIGRDANITLVEDGIGESSAAESALFSCTHIRARENANVKRLFIQNLPESTQALMFAVLELSRGSQAEFTSLSLGGGATRYEQRVHLNGDGASFVHSGVNFASHAQVMEMNLIQNHTRPYTTSDLHLRSVLNHKARTLFNGNIIISSEAPKTNAGQTNHNLLLHREAQATTLPKLEIGTDDVQCKHGATVSTVDDLQLFYLMSRGIPRARATRLLVEGFFTDTLERVTSPDLHAQLSAALSNKLDEIERL